VGRSWASARRWSPGCFAFFLLAFAGLPLTSGFTGKFAVFAAAVEGDAAPLVVVGVVTSAIAAFLLHPRDRPNVLLRARGRRAVRRRASAMTVFAITVGAVVTVVLGVFPQPVLDLAAEAAQSSFVR
jgi:NADH-quinone oxidoreductase subunit N